MLQIGLPEGINANIGSNVILTYISIIKNGVVDPYGDVVVGNVKVILQSCRLSNYDISNPHEVFDEVFSIAQFWGYGYYHATIEEIIRLAPYIQFLKKHPNIKIHVNTQSEKHKIPNFVKIMLWHLGIAESRIVSGTIGAKIVYLPAGTLCGHPNVFNVVLLSLLLRSAIKQEPQPRTSIMIIKRSDRRYFKQHDAIAAMIGHAIHVQYPMLANANIKIEVFPDDPLPSMEKTMEMFSRAFLVIAPHGAGLSNLLFSEPGTIVVEGLCKFEIGYYLLHYRTLSALLGHRYYGIVQKDYSCLDFQPEDIEVPLGITLRKCLKELKLKHV